MTGNKKKSMGKLFAMSLLKSLLSIAILLVAGFCSYKVSYYFLSKSATTIKTDEESIKEILKEAQTEDISKNLIYVCNEKDQITHMMLEICNTNTNNMDYVTIPTRNDYTIPSTMYRKLCTISENIPQIIRISKIKQYFDDEEQAYGYGLLIVEKMLGTSLSYYTVLDQETYDNHYQQVKVKLSYKKTEDAAATPTPTPSESAAPASSSTKTKMKISCASEAYINQLKDVQGDESKIVEYIKSQYDRVNSNLTVTNKIGYIKSYEAMNVDYFHYWGCPGSYDGKIFTVDTKAAKKFIKSLVDNEVPYTTAQDLTTTQKATAVPASTTSQKSKTSTKKAKKVSSKGKNILVLNGSKINGLAGKTQQKLQDAGYTVPKVGDYTNETVTVTKIIVKEDGQGEDLAKYFKNPEVTVGMVEDGYDIEIIVGTTDANQ
ncbi:MAG: LytR C-terminal domain-containing protein [Lachnospiraceae bacterium]|nr:LytR C-terminal domain-containing protein [Lachnospiraceae bacterium]